ncbi:hypothetical protein Dda_5216 [Drechslerella dactyloides]|uniref:Uncharacterized protein n=1 Tax=Drechslerella dactyloides TaxID=74499 RepID=A0AAD6IVN7_DREDA|nr:hypothetical protein Dda_5216 [Drechslerella dactyloides]
MAPAPQMLPPFAPEILEDGEYMITSVILNLKVSRMAMEDRSRLPKKVVVLPRHQEKYAAPWRIIKNGDGTYTMMNKGGSASQIEGGLWAQLEHGVPPIFARWNIKRVPIERNSNGLPTPESSYGYYIESADDNTRWIVQKDSAELRDPKQVACSNLGTLTGKGQWFFINKV